MQVFSGQKKAGGDCINPRTEVAKLMDAGPNPGREAVERKQPTARALGCKKKSEQAPNERSSPPTSAPHSELFRTFQIRFKTSKLEPG
jgi:hypothetical protein